MYLSHSLSLTQSLARSFSTYLSTGLSLSLHLNLVDVSDIFYFFLLGDGEGGVRGVRRGGVSGRERQGGCLRRIGDSGAGGAKGQKSQPSKAFALCVSSHVVFRFRLSLRPQSGKTNIYHHRATQILADAAKAMVAMTFLCFPGFAYLP